MHRVLERQLRKIGVEGGPPTAEQWAKLLERIDHAYTEADQDRYTLERALDLSSEEMRKRLDALRDAQGQLLLASRKAGMADVATSVLHNVGNVLNSVNVSSNMIAESIRSSARGGLGKALALLNGQAQPGKFMDEDPRGRKLVPYLTAIDKALSDERAAMLRETESLAKNIEHIKSIVSQQLAAARGDARGAKILERVTLCELLDDAVAVVRASSTSSQEVNYIHERDSLVIAIDRHKVFQILVNLLTNARDAIAARQGPGVITLRTRRLAERRVAIDVVDDGVGIAPATLARVFSNGFTTKSNGHGVGLHSSACAAGELEGSLTGVSDGLGRGATFTLTLPDGHAAATSRMPPSRHPELRP